MKKQWDGKMYTFTVCPYASPELHAAVADLPARARAERIKQLALLGLAMLTRPAADAVGQALQARPAAPVAEPEAEQGAFAKLKQDRRAQLVGQLRNRNH